jgi:hypothetical protein
MTHQRPTPARPHTGNPIHTFTHTLTSASRGRRALLVGALGSLALTLSGGAGPQLSDHAAETPRFDLQTYFTGDLRAHGMVSDRGGRVIRRFVVDLRGEWNGDQGVLDEQFVYDDGERQRRVWRLRNLGDGRYSGQADDVVGEAFGEQSGAAFNWRYTLRLPVRGDVYDVQFDDWIHLIDENTALNRAVMSKWGVRVGEVTLSFTRK